MVDKTQEEVKIPTQEELLNTEGQTTPEPTTEEPQYTELELKAIEQGWKPLDKWEGDPKEHRSAREYMDRGELLGKIKSYSSQLHEIRQALQGMTEHNKRVWASGYEKALGDLKAAKAEALREGDADAVVHLDEKIDEAKDALRTINRRPPPQEMGPSETTRQWLKDNEWYSNNRVMKAFANEVAQSLGRTVPGINEEDLYQEIDREVRKEFPDHFKQRKLVQGAPSPDGGGRQASTAGSRQQLSAGAMTFEKLLTTMDETQASIARNLIKTGAISKEKYVEDYSKITGGR